MRTLRLPSDWRAWLVTLTILAALAALIAFDWTDDDGQSCIPPAACRDIPEDELR